MCECIKHINMPSLVACCQALKTYSSRWGAQHVPYTSIIPFPEICERDSP